MSLFLNVEDGYYSLTPMGSALSIIIVLVLLCLTALPRRKAQRENTAGGARKETGFSNRQLAFSASAVALAFAASYIRIIPLPWGGAVTLCSMLFITLIGYWFGPVVGLSAASAYSFLQFFQDGGSYILSPLQVCLDYFFAFTALGVSGFFSHQKNGLLKGYIAAILFRGLFHTIGGYLYWMDYMPDSFPRSMAFAYPFLYNYAYILLEGVLTILLLQIPAVKKGLRQITMMARQDS